jgi:hypothetical protein
VIADGTNPGKITVAAAVTCEIKTGNTGGSVITVGTANGISTASGAGKLTASAANAFAVKTLSGSNKLESITGTGNGPGTLSGNAGSTAPVTINSEFEVTG